MDWVACFFDIELAGGFLTTAPPGKSHAGRILRQQRTQDSLSSQQKILKVRNSIRAKIKHRGMLPVKYGLRIKIIPRL